MAILDDLRGVLGLDYSYEIDEDTGRATIYLEGEPVASCIGEGEVKEYFEAVYEEWVKEY